MSIIWTPVSQLSQPAYDVIALLSLSRGLKLYRGENVVVTGWRARTDKSGDHYIVPSWNEANKHILYSPNKVYTATDWILTAFSPLPDPYKVGGEVSADTPVEEDKHGHGLGT